MAVNAMEQISTEERDLFIDDTWDDAEAEAPAPSSRTYPDFGRSTLPMCCRESLRRHWMDPSA